MDIPDNEMINVSYTNWRGETAVRRVLLGSIRFGTTEWHEEPTWLISAFDLDHPAQIWKEFDLTKCDFHREQTEVKKLRKCLSDTRHEICTGPVDDTLWHTGMPACTTVDNICMALDDDWDYDAWLAKNANTAKEGGNDAKHD